MEGVSTFANLTAHYCIKCAMRILYWDLFYLSNDMSGQIGAVYKAAYLLEVQLLGCELQLRGTHQPGTSFEKELRFEAKL